MSSFKKILLLFICFLLNFSIISGAERVITAGSRSGPETLDPAEVWDNSATIYIANVFNRLVELEAGTMKIKPSLASKWESNEGGTVWTFHLRRGVEFHDGTAFDADAVVFTFERQLYGKYKYGEFVLFKEIFPFLKSVKKTGKYKVQFILKEPFFQFPATLSVDCTSIISPSSMKEQKEKFRFNPVGTGPYRIGEWKKGKRIVLESFNGYWKGKPRIDKYITIFEDNIDKLFEMFRDQRIDILMNFSISKMVIFKGYNWVASTYSPSLSTNYIAFNMKNKYLAKLRVRRALNYMWNKNILKLVYQNHVEPLCSLFPKGMSGYDCNFDRYPMSVEKAKVLLKKEGLHKGFKLKFLVDRDWDLLLRVVDLYSKNLKKVGIKIKVVSVSYEEYMSRVAKGEYDLTFSSWLSDYPDPFNIISPLVSEKLQKEGLANISSGNSSELTEMISKSRTIKDPADRDKFYIKLNEYVIDRALLIPLYQNINLLLYNKRIGKLRQDSFGKIDLFLLGKQ